ncbi:unnamed protein product [Arabidopsis thaliana]|uniref:(thale cress) hypothetical protein n=1 Tax=Arabidopsis thaliana TaxID=3702 RepID=A0A7G2FIB5_ARATH|nr:unnamed protein product [Arabidopsis thaliana]
MATTTQHMNQIFLVLLLISFAISPAISTVPKECETDSTDSCIDKTKALPLKIVAIVAILVTSMIGVAAPLFSRYVTFLHPDGKIFMIIKCFASGIILGTGFMHVLPDSFEMLSSPCLEDNPWHKFPFTGFVAMLSGLVTLAIDSIATSLYTKKFVADVLELGIIVHSVVIGLSLGATNDTCTIKGLIAALCFHQMFEGMGLGGCILQAEYTNVKKFVMAFFFAVTTPSGIALGIALSSVYKDNSPTALITVGLLNACSAGLLIYMALVDLLAAEFMGSMLQGSVKLQLNCFGAALLGCGGMSVLAKWA